MHRFQGKRRDDDTDVQWPTVPSGWMRARRGKEESSSHYK